MNKYYNLILIITLSQSPRPQDCVLTLIFKNHTHIEDLFVSLLFHAILSESRGKIYFFNHIQEMKWGRPEFELITKVEA